MNSLIEKIKRYYSSIFGKFAIMIMGLAFIITFIVSFLFRNRIDVTFFKSIVSMIIVGIILYLLSFVLKKYLGDIIDTSSVDNTLTPSFPVDINNNTETNTENKESEDTIETVLENNDNNVEVNDKDIKVASSIDKEDATSNMRGDIGDIIMSAPSYNDFVSGNYSSTSSLSSIPNTTTSSSSSSSFDSMYTSTDKKVNEMNVERAALEDPDKTAKALRTMMSKDDKKEN